jgi:hypothetical protein
MQGHKRLELRSAGERSRSENSWTFVCECGAQESAGTKKETTREWNHHLASVKKSETRKVLQKLAEEVRDLARHAANCAPLHGKDPVDLIENIELHGLVDMALDMLE